MLAEGKPIVDLPRRRVVTMLCHWLFRSPPNLRDLSFPLVLDLGLMAEADQTR